LSIKKLFLFAIGSGTYVCTVDFLTKGVYSKLSAMNLMSVFKAIWETTEMKRDGNKFQAHPEGYGFLCDQGPQTRELLQRQV